MINKCKYRFTILKHLLPFSKGVKGFFVSSFALKLIVMVTAMITPVFYKLFIDEVIIHGRFDITAIVICGYLGLFLIEVAIGYLQNFVQYRMNNTLLFRVKNRIWNNFFKLPFSEYEHRNIGDMKMRLEDDISQISAFTGMQTVDSVIAFLTLLISGVILFVIDIRLALFSIIVIPITFSVDNALSKREAVLNNANRQNEESMSAWLHSSFQGWREVKALNLGKKQEIRFVRYLHNYALYFAVWINYWTARVLVIPKIKNEFLMRFGLYFLGGLLIINGELEISSLLVFASYYGTLSNSVRTLSDADANLKSNMPYSDRLLEELNRVPIASKQGIVPDSSNIIEFENITFAYDRENGNVISNFNLRIEKGERVAITGKSGCGKTTVLKLICGMLMPNSGKVSFSGVDIKDIDISAMHSHIGFIMQENLLFNTTIRENLLYGNNNASEDELIEALKKAYIYDFVKELPDRLDTVIGERGIKLSGGQKQRIVLARMFLRDVDVYIFDEATSALDQYSENFIHEAIETIAPDKTIIIVAHRESSISLCDRKITLD